MSTIREIDCKCPFCKEKFTETIQGSCSLFGLDMDSMPTGAAIVPNPIVRCPKCGFTEGNFSKEEGKSLKKYLKKNKFDPREPCYYTLAREYEFVNKDDKLIADTYLNAFWESIGNYAFLSIEEEGSRFFQKLTIDKIDKIDSTDPEFMKYQLIKLDLVRRLGDFDWGLSLIYEFTNNLFHPCSDELKEFLKIEKELIKNKDTDSHALSKHLGVSLFGTSGEGIIFYG